MGLIYNVYLDSAKIYGCKNCKAHLSNHEDIISRVSSFVLFYVYSMQASMRVVYLSVMKEGADGFRRAFVASMAKRTFSIPWSMSWRATLQSGT